MKVNFTTELKAEAYKSYSGHGMYWYETVSTGKGTKKVSRMYIHSSVVWSGDFTVRKMRGMYSLTPASKTGTWYITEKCAENLGIH